MSLNAARRRLMSIGGCFVLGISGCFLFNSCQNTASLGSLTGVVSLGRVNGGLVCAFALTATGARGALLGCATTDSSGTFTIPITPQTTPVEIFTTGGSYVEEASGATVQVGINQIRARVPDTTLPVPITPLTEIAAGCADAQSPTSMSLLTTAVTQCNTNVAKTAGLSSILTIPSDPSKAITSATSDSSLYALVLAGISHTAKDNNLPSSIVVTQALESDFQADGIYDGTNNGTPIQVPGTSTPMPANLWTSGVVTGMTEFANSTAGAANGFGAVTHPTLAPFVPPSSCPSGQSVCVAACFNLDTSKANCGTCGNTCATPTNAIAGCASGTCGIGSCNSGFADCNHLSADGCETNINTDINNCGACGAACALAHATAGCSSGTCTIASCNSGFANCDANPSNGCETNINTNVSNCGTCGNICATANGTAGCTSGSCTVASCNAGFAHCSGMGTNCETATGNDPNNCGTCGVLVLPPRIQSLLVPRGVALLPVVQASETATAILQTAVRPP